jgi:hypothetical protein
MARQRTAIITGSRGYFSIPLGANLPEDALIYPSANILRRPNAAWESFPGFTSAGANLGGTVSHLLGNGYAAIGLNETTDRGSGNVNLFQNYSLWFTTTGTVRVLVPEVSGSLTTVAYPGAGALQYTTTIPQVAVRDMVGGGWKAPRQVGLSEQLVAPNLQVAPVVGSGFEGKMTGSYSTVVSALRTDTGDESFASPPSPVVQFTNQTAYLTFPPARTDGSESWRVYFTFRNFGSFGGYQMYKDYTEAAVAASTAGSIARTIEVDFLDNELLSVSPPDKAFAPTGSADFIVSLANVMILIGTYNGLGVSASVPGYAGQYPPENVQFLSERAIGVSFRPQDNHLWILCKNSIWLLVLTGATYGSPIALRPMVDNVGSANAQSHANVGLGLYWFTPGRVPARIDGDGTYDTTFGEAVKNDMASWDSTKVRVIFDEKNYSIIYTNGATTFIFYPVDGTWSPPIHNANVVLAGRPNGDIASMFYLQGVVHASVWNVGAAQYDLYLFDSGTAGSAWTMQHSWNYLGSGHMLKDFKSAIHDVSTAAGATITGRVYGDGDLSTLRGEYQFTVASGLRVSKWSEPNVPELRLMSLQLSGSGYQHRIYTTEIEYILRRMRL